MVTARRSTETRPDDGDTGVLATGVSSTLRSSSERSGLFQGKGLKVIIVGDVMKALWI